MATLTLYFARPTQTDIATLHVYEGISPAGPWTEIDTSTAIGGFPTYITSFETALATDVDNYFSVAWEDVTNNIGSQYPATKDTPSTEIFASLNDVNANLDNDVVSATYSETSLIQISVARIIRGYLRRVVDNVTLATWVTPETTPEIIREIAGKFIAAQLYMNRVSRSADGLVEDTSFAQRKYNEAMTLLNKIVSGEIAIDGVTETTTAGFSEANFFPVDATDRAFTMSKNFY